MISDYEPLVSIISPLHNEERFLTECIESVLAQTYKHWEYILVDNCSTDQTVAIATAYPARDPRIRVHVCASFVQVIESYNRAFRQISPHSKYCKVLAGDDWLYPECIEKMVRIAEEFSNVAIVGAYSCRGELVVWDGLLKDRRVGTGHEVCRAYLKGERYVFGTPTSLLYKSNIVRSRPAFFNESNLHADSEVCLEVLENADFGFVNEVLTFLRVRDDSLTVYAQKYNTYLPYGLYILTKYGPCYLSEDELRHRVKVKIREYYVYLGKQIFQWRNTDLWNLHRVKLQELGSL